MNDLKRNDMFISVALCTHNGMGFLEEQIDSILNQTLTVDEIIVCDDASTDETYSIIEKYFHLYPNIFKLFRNEIALGTIKNFEKAISLTLGDLIFLADQDDIWNLDKVEKSCAFFKENTTCVLLFSNAELIDNNGDKIGALLWDKWGFDDEKKRSWQSNEVAFEEMIHGKNKITGATVCFSKILKKSIFPIKLPLHYWHDSWLGTHAAALNGLFFIDDCLIKYRVHDKQQIGISAEVSNEVTLKSNIEYISKEEYLSYLKKKYPKLKKYFPKQDKKKTNVFFDQIFRKIKLVYKYTRKN